MAWRTVRVARPLIATLPVVGLASNAENRRFAASQAVPAASPKDGAFVAPLSVFLRRGAPVACEVRGQATQEHDYMDIIASLQRENARLKAHSDDLEDRLKEKAHIYRIVITGGPCAGKTTAMTSIRSRLEKVGWRVFIVPEAATLLFHNGARFHDFLAQGEPGVIHFQTQLASLQMKLEDTMYDMAMSTGEKSVLLCDRGTMDGKAYCSPPAWALVLDGLGQSESQLRDRRYDCVVHLVTAAQGAEEFYTLTQAEGGVATARTETPEEAKAQDERTSQAWIGHEHLYIIDNTKNFRHKLERALDRVCKNIGEGVTGHMLRKIALPHMTSEEIALAAAKNGVTCRVFLCATTYVNPTTRIRMRSNPDHHGTSFYLQTFREDPVKKRFRRAREKLIDSREYMLRLKEAHATDNRTVEKELVCFQWGDCVYEVNVFTWPEKACILEVEAESHDAPIAIPPFLRSEDAREVTTDKKYETQAIATRAIMLE